MPCVPESFMKDKKYPSKNSVRTSVKIRETIISSPQTHTGNRYEEAYQMAKRS